MHFHTISSVISLHPSLQVYDSNRVSCHATTENWRDIQSKKFHKGTKEKCVIKNKVNWLSSTVVLSQKMSCWILIGWFQLNICLFFLWSTKFAFFGTNTSFLLRYIKIWFCVELLIISKVSLFSWPCPKINAIQTSDTSSHYIKEVLIGRGVYVHMHMYMCKKKKSLLILCYFIDDRSVCLHGPENISERTKELHL